MFAATDSTLLPRPVAARDGPRRHGQKRAASSSESSRHGWGDPRLSVSSPAAAAGTNALHTCSEGLEAVAWFSTGSVRGYCTQLARGHFHVRSAWSWSTLLVDLTAPRHAGTAWGWLEACFCNFPFPSCLKDNPAACPQPRGWQTLLAEGPGKHPRNGKEMWAVTESLGRGRTEGSTETKTTQTVLSAVGTTRVHGGWRVRAV